MRPNKLAEREVRGHGKDEGWSGELLAARLQPRREGENEERERERGQGCLLSFEAEASYLGMQGKARRRMRIESVVVVCASTMKSTT